MSEMSNSKSDKNRELLVFQYIESLEANDWQQIEAILLHASTDHELARIILEVEATIAEEENLLLETDTLAKVKNLINQHLVSTFESEQQNLANSLQPLTVGEVAAKLKAKNKLSPNILQLNELLIKSKIIVPEPSWQNIKNLAGQLDIVISDVYWKQFRDEAISLGIARSHNQAQLAARERKLKKSEE